MAEVGKRKIVYSGTFIVPDGDEVLFDINADQWLLKINVIFTKKKAGENRAIGIEASSGNVKITLIDWENSLGTATKEPVKLGQHTDGRTLSFMATAYSISLTKKLDIQFFLEEE